MSKEKLEEEESKYDGVNIFLSKFYREARPKKTKKKIFFSFNLFKLRIVKKKSSRIQPKNYSLISNKRYINNGSFFLSIYILEILSNF